MSNFSFSHSVFKRLILQTRKNQGLFGKGFKLLLDDNFKFDENGKKFFKQVENTVAKGEIAIFPFSHSVFKRLVLQTHKNQGLFGKGLI